MTMRQTRSWPAVVAVGLSAAILAVVGCSSNAGKPSEPTKPTPSPTKADPPDDGKLMADWTPDPQGVLLITGQQIGYLEPCGCTSNQKGGLVRRSVLAGLLKRQGWPVALIDLGSLIADPARARGGPEQTKLKFATSLKALLDLQYDALALSADDLRIGTAEALMQLDNTLPEAPDTLKAVAANVVPATGLGFEKKLRPSVRTQAGPFKIGVTAVLDPDRFQELQDPGKAELLTVQSPEETLPSVLADLEKDTHIQVLMVQGPPELARRLAKTYPGFDIVVATSLFPDPPDKPEELNDGKTWLITVGTKGQYVGVVGLWQSNDPARKMRYRRLVLNSRYDTHKDLAEAMKKRIGADFQETLKSAGILESYPKRPYALYNVPSDATYVGAETCKTCHPGTFAKWSTTKHAQAYEVLVHDPHDPDRNREYDAACITCHTTGFEYVGGFVNTALTPNLKGNQCENCHGPGSKHAAEPDNEAYRKAIARSSEDFDRNHRCIQCHDEDNDPNFDFGTYWPKIMHQKLDSYDDPKVHQGIEPPKAKAEGADGGL